MNVLSDVTDAKHDISKSRTSPRKRPLLLSNRVLLTVGCAVAAGALAGIRDQASDLDHVLGAAHAWMAGRNPYEVVGPGREVTWAFPLLYPFTAVLLAVPLNLLPHPQAWFSAAGFALFVWGVTGRRELRFAWFAMATFAAFHAAKMVQWSPLLTGAALVPACGFLLACKPTIGGALWLAYPKWVSLAGSLWLLAISLIEWPGWPFAWWTALQQTGHMQAPVTYWGGPLILLGLLRWRRPEARLLVALACVPQTAFLYDALPLFLIPRKYEEGFFLALASHAVLVAVHVNQLQWQGWSPEAQYYAERQVFGQWMVWLLYLPSLAMVLRRPNHDADGLLWPMLGHREATG